MSEINEEMIEEAKKVKNQFQSFIDHTIEEIATKTIPKKQGKQLLKLAKKGMKSQEAMLRDIENLFRKQLNKSISKKKAIIVIEETK